MFFDILTYLLFFKLVFILSLSYFSRRSLLINELLFPSSWDQQPAEPQIMYMLSKENPGISAARKSAAYSDWVNAAETTSFMTLI